MTCGDCGNFKKAGLEPYSVPSMENGDALIALCETVSADNPVCSCFIAKNEP